MKSMRPHTNHDNAEFRTSGFTKFVYAVFVVNVLAALLLLLGLFAGWFGVDGDRMTDGTYRLGLVFDSQEVGDDIGDTLNTAGNLSETAKTATALETHDGVIHQLDREASRVVLTSEGESYEVQITEATEFEGDGAADISGLQIGDRVRLTVQKKNDHLFAVKVKEEAQAASEQ